MMAPELSYIHRFEPGADPTLPPILLLHGTGGNETDLVPLGREIAPGAALLSPRGNVLEGDRPRFFRRFREGLFDEDDVRRRAGELSHFVMQARRAYGLDQPLALGYSNGANIAAAVLCCIRRFWRAQSCCAPWRRWPSCRAPFFPAFPC